MAKRETNRRKQAKGKRETNAQRREREYNRRTTLLMAKRIAETISERRKNKADLAPESMEELPSKELKTLGWHPETKRWRKTYTSLGQDLCEFCPFDENPSEFLRLIADYLDGKPPPYSPGDDWYDDKIRAAFREACRRMPRPRVTGTGVVIVRWPSFSEFQNIFLEQSPKSKLVSEYADSEERKSLKREGYTCYTERSLRRSLKRLGCTLRSVKRGPKERNQAKEDDGWQMDREARQIVEKIGT